MKDVHFLNWALAIILVCGILPLGQSCVEQPHVNNVPHKHISLDNKPIDVAVPDMSSVHKKDDDFLFSAPLFFIN